MARKRKAAASKAKRIARQNKATPEQAFEDEVTPRDERSALRTGRTPAETARIRRTVEEMLSHNLPTEEIAQAMQGEFKLNANQTRNLIHRVRKAWRDTDAERRSDYKLAAQKRLLKTIAAARAKQDFGAVATLERLLADIQGTKEPERIQIDVNATVRSAVEVSLAQMTAEQIRAFAQDFRQRRARLGIERGQRVPRRLANNDDVIDVEAESVSD